MNKNKVIKNILLASLFVASALFFYILGSGGLSKDKDNLSDEYNITLSSTTGGSITSNVEKAKEGDSIFISVSLDENYSFKEWEIISGDFIVENNEFVMPASDVSLKAIFEEHSQTVQIDDLNLLKDVMNIFSGRLGYSYCSLDFDILNELYSGSVDVNTLSNESLLLIAINNETIEGEFGSLLNKNYLNNKIKTILNTDREIDFSSINAQITNYSYEDHSADEINIKMNIFGCVEGLDDIARDIVSGEEDDTHLYIYERIAFGQSNEYGKVLYYNDTEFSEFIEEVEYDEQLPSTMVNFDLYNLYKYTFIKDGNNYKLDKIEKQIN